MPWFEVDHFELAAVVRMMGEMEPEELWVPGGRTWKAKAPELRFPTFTRPIARRRPPPSPAGLEGSSDEAKFRWAHDQFKFPPYTYEEKYLLEDQEGRFYKLPAVSREALMGFAQGHTLRLDRELFKKTNLAEAEDIRQAALGNSWNRSESECMGYKHLELKWGDILGQLLLLGCGVRCRKGGMASFFGGYSGFLFGNELDL
eukprot:s1948_g17.t1